MAAERGGRTEGNAFGFYLAVFCVILILMGAVFLLLPIWRDLRGKEQERARLESEVERLKSERNEKLEKVAALEKSPDAVEKVAREKFKLVRPGDTVLEYQIPKETASDK